MYQEPEIISRSELKEKIDRNDDFEPVEVLSREQFADLHLPGAVNLPGDRAPDRYGYTDVKDYPGGREHWKEGGVPVEPGEPVGVTA